MAIHGIEAPKFVSGATTVDLDYAIIKENKPVTSTRMNESEETGIRDFKAYAHRRVVIQMQIFQETDAADKYREVIPYLYTEVTLYLHRDGNQFKDADGGTVPFYFERCQRINLTDDTDIGNNEAIILTFISTMPVDMAVTAA